MKCPICESQLGWIGDFTCDEVTGCECEEGIVGLWYCTGENCDAQLQITTNCKGYE